MPNYPFSRSRVLWLRLVLVSLLLLGIGWRCIDLDRKVYWYDEGFTAVRVGGYISREVVQQTFTGRVISVADFRQYLSPNLKTGVKGTIRSLAVEDPQHPPLHYVLARFWQQCFGDSVIAIRSLSVLFSLLTFPGIYWLCWELFRSPTVGWVATAVIAISPFHLLFAQEAREYSLWSLTILLSSAALLRALRLNTKLSWGMYAIALTLGLYTFLFSVFVAVGQGVYVFIIAGCRFSKTFIAYLLATLVGLLAFVPWIWVVVTNFSRLDQSTAWMAAAETSLSQLTIAWADNISLIFFSSTSFNQILLPPLIILIGYAFYLLCHQTPIRVWLFILTLFITTALALIMPDLITGGQRSMQTRFLIPCYLSIQIALAYLLTTKFTSRHRIAWQLVAIALVSSGVISSTLISQAEVPWNKTKSYYDYQIARTVNQADNPLLVVNNYTTRYDSNASYLFGFSYLLDTKVHLQLVKGSEIPQIPDGFSDIYLYNPCELQSAKSGLAEDFQVLVDELAQRQNYQLEPVKISQPVLLWRLVKS